MSRALHAEWNKVRTVRGPVRLLVAAIALTGALGVVADAAARCPSGNCRLDPARISLTGIYLSQAAVTILAVLAISGEYGSGMIRVTFTAVPHRTPPACRVRRSAPGPVWGSSPPGRPRRCWPAGCCSASGTRDRGPAPCLLGRLREQRDGRRKGVQEVLPAYRPEFSVAEESRQRDLAQRRGDQPRVVVRRGEHA